MSENKKKKFYTSQFFPIRIERIAVHLAIDEIKIESPISRAR